MAGTIYVRDPKGVTPCAEDGTCGACETGVVLPKVGELCMVCGATVVQVGETESAFPPSPTVVPDLPSDAGLSDGMARKDAGIARVEFNQPEWRDRVRAWLVVRAGRPGSFSSDDLYTSIEPPDGWNKSTQNTVGASFSWANKAKLINMVGFKNSARASAHGRKIPVYVGSSSGVKG